jgi:hypothetical protein
MISGEPSSSMSWIDGPAHPSEQRWLTGLHAAQFAPAGRGAFHSSPHVAPLFLNASVEPSAP